MKIGYKTIVDMIKSAEESQLKKIKSFYYTFGYIILSDAVSDDEIDSLRRRVTTMAEGLAPKDSRGRPEIKKTVIMHKALEGDTATLEWFINKKEYIRIIRYLLGESSVFFNSDANVFVHASSWHRDVGTILPTLKFLVYLQDSQKNGAGDFALIPGSQWVTDTYSSYLNANGSWPTGVPFSHNYHNVQDNTTRRASGRVHDGGQFPFHTIKVKKNDVILFDSRLYHTTYAHDKSRFSIFKNKNFHRLNLSALFIANPVDLNRNSMLRSRLATDSTGSELDSFFNTIMNFEDCRYHANLKDVSAYPEFEKSLYFSKFGFTDQGETIFDSAGTQKDAEKDLRKWFIPTDKLPNQS